MYVEVNQPVEKVVSGVSDMTRMLDEPHVGGRQPFQESGCSS